ncbi:MAG: hypothetical protein P1V51_06860 [Deltaproteobacteria bacterium]|nr:hypothetical protein [Deltaproteobacteria bacterium]
MGSGIEVRRVEDEGTERDFHALPYRIYRDDPTWVPPLDLYQRSRLSPKKPFFKEATLHRYVAYREGEPVGTISALRDPRHERVREERTAFFGFFDLIDDAEVAEALIERVKADARSWGATTLRGPRNLTRVEEVGVVVEGFDRPQPMLAGASRPYYQALLEALGAEKHHDVLAYDIEMYFEDGRPKPIPDYLLQKASEVDLPGLVLRPANRLQLNRDLRLAHECFVEAFRDVPENTPMPLSQFVGLGRAFLFVSNRHMLQLATVDGKAAGFALCFPDLNEAIIKAQGKTLPFGWARLLWGLHGVRTSSFKLIGVLPEYRKSGLHSQMIVRAIDGSRDAGYRRMEASLVDERNDKMRKVVESTGMEVYRRYRFYDFQVD